MTREQSVLFMNIMAQLLGYLQKFMLSFQMIHALTGFESIGVDVYQKMDAAFKNNDTDGFLKFLGNISRTVILKVNQRNMLFAYHMCRWMDRKLTYEDVAKDRLSIYRMIPLSAFSYVEIDALNDNYKEVGIWINPKLPIFKSALSFGNGEEKERNTANRDAFIDMNGELYNISYFKWNGSHIVHNIIFPFEYAENGIEDNADGNLRIGFIPVSDKQNLIIPNYKNIKEDKYQFKKMDISHPNHEKDIEIRLKKGLELACENEVDIVFAPEMLGTEHTEQKSGKYNMYIRNIYSDMVSEGLKPPFMTVMPSYWNKGVNSAAIVWRDGHILGRQRKYTPYIDFESCSVEKIKKEEPKEMYIIHVYGVHRIAISICAEFIDSFNSNLICGQLGATLIIVPSFSHGERDFVNSLATLFPYGTSVIWGDCCGAVIHTPKIIGGCSIVGLNEVHKMGECCHCSYTCAGCSGCLFTIDLPLKIVMSKAAQRMREPIRHILSME